LHRSNGYVELAEARVQHARGIFASDARDAGKRHGATHASERSEVGKRVNQGVVLLICA